MKLWLDDERPAPAGWTRVMTAWHAIAWIRTGKVTECSLDYDLGPERNGTGYDVLKWIEEQAYYGKVWPFSIYVHTGNVVASKRMMQAEASIARIWNARMIQLTEKKVRVAIDDVEIVYLTRNQ